jgi:hypothetical protein
MPKLQYRILPGFRGNHVYVRVDHYQI